MSPSRLLLLIAAITKDLEALPLGSTLPNTSRLLLSWKEKP